MPGRLLLLAALVAVAGAAVVAADNDVVCNNQQQVCWDTSTRAICADLGSGLIPISKIPCPADNPFCKNGFCGPAPTTTTTTTTTTTPPPDPCGGLERSCVDAHTLRVCADLGAGLIPLTVLPCDPEAPLCERGVCVAAPTTAPPTSAKPTTAKPTSAKLTTAKPTTASRRPSTRRPTPTTPTATTSTTTLAPNACAGQSYSCLDDSTCLICADLGSGLVPAKEVTCPASKPHCRSGTCVASPPTTTPSPRTTPAPPADICGGKLSVCGDCYTRTTCARIGREIIPVSNTSCSADKPYCVAGACEADLPADSSCTALPAPASSFKCFGDGYFPEPSDCRRFHLCVDDKAYDYDCSEAAAGLIYSQARALCVPAGQAQCFAFNCRGRANTYLTYEPDPTLYALCVTEDADDALMARCPAGHRLVVDPVDPLNVGCQPFCARAGRTADPEDASGASFYECFATLARSDRLVGPLKGTCPQGSTFDAASERCQSTTVRADLVPFPVATTPTPTTKTKKPWWF